MKDFQRLVRPDRRGIVAAVTVWVFAAGGVGCAYFNTLYNAKKLYAEAQEIPKARDGTAGSSAKTKYEEAMKKCEALLVTYPKSKHVDDAVLLIGKCLYEQGEYDAAIARLEELETISPDAKVKAEGRLVTAKSHVAKGEIETAVPMIKQLVDSNPKKATDETLFILGTALVKMGSEDEAVKYLELLAKGYPRSPFRVNADLEVAGVYAERGEYEKSLSMYERLEYVGLSEKDRIRYLSERARVYTEMGQYEKAISSFRLLEDYVLDPVERAPNMLVLARAQVGMDSIAAAIDTYSSVAVSYPRTPFSAEARFRLGEIYQDKLDSLQVAQEQFDEVSRQSANSPFAEEALGRSSTISRLLRLRESLESGGEGDQAAVQFDLAEIEMLQFKNYAKAIDGYKKIIETYPGSDLAPKAAYAIAYVYDVRLGDVQKAREAYEYVVSRYPDTQQAEYARRAIARFQMETPEQP